MPFSTMDQSLHKKEKVNKCILRKINKQTREEGVSLSNYKE
jgi:hypothetical protein